MNERPGPTAFDYIGGLNGNIVSPVTNKFSV
jgi:hypothetical protein